MSKKIITSDIPSNDLPDLSSHTLSVFVNNTPGVLMRITQVFARRGFNIDSLVVSEGRDDRFSRMTIGITGSSNGLEQIIKQLNKLIDVIRIGDHTTDDLVTREIALFKIRAGVDNRMEIMQLTQIFQFQSVSRALLRVCGESVCREGKIGLGHGWEK